MPSNNSAKFNDVLNLDDDEDFFAESPKKRIETGMSDYSLEGDFMANRKRGVFIKGIL